MGLFGVSETFNFEVPQFVRTLRENPYARKPSLSLQVWTDSLVFLVKGLIGLILSFTLPYDAEDVRLERWVCRLLGLFLRVWATVSAVLYCPHALTLNPTQPATLPQHPVPKVDTL